MKNLFLLVLAISLGSSSGCKKKPEAEVEAIPEVPVAASEASGPAASAAPTGPASPKVAEPLPGAAGVRKDLKDKNWLGAMDGLLALKQMASRSGGETWMAFRELNGEVGIALAEAAPGDPKAAQALAVYRAATYGR